MAKLNPNESRRNAYSDIRTFLEDNFEHKQGYVYFSIEEMSAVECVTIAQDLAAQFDWFTAYCKDVRMLRIEDDSNLMPALDHKRLRKTIQVGRPGSDLEGVASWRVCFE